MVMVLEAGLSAQSFSDYQVTGSVAPSYQCPEYYDGGYAGGVNWSELAMNWALGRGLFNGMPGVINAKDNCPRSDVVYYLWKTFD